MYFRYFCLECQLLFPDDAAYLQHKRTTHSTMGAPMTCWDCGETFTYYVDLSQVTHTWCWTFIKVKENIPILPIGILDFCWQRFAAPYLELIDHQVFTIKCAEEQENKREQEQEQLVQKLNKVPPPSGSCQIIFHRLKDYMPSWKIENKSLNVTVFSDGIFFLIIFIWIFSPCSIAWKCTVQAGSRLFRLISWRKTTSVWFL